MTAEIAILNQEAVALASDSAATVEIGEGRPQKVFPTVYKIFPLSHRYPVGVMFYQNSNFMDVPWSTLVRIYSERLGDRSFDTLSEYAEDFLGFLQAEPRLKAEDHTRNFVARTVFWWFDSIKTEIQGRLAEGAAAGGITEQDAVATADAIVAGYEQSWRETPLLFDRADRQANALVASYADLIDSAIANVEEVISLSTDAKANLRLLGNYLFSRDRLAYLGYSGVVVAGFGESELFPSLVCYEVEGVTESIFKYRKTETHQISASEPGWMVAFAQQEAIEGFVGGADPSFINLAIEAISASLGSILERVRADVKGITAKKWSEIQEVGTSAADDVLASLRSRLDDLRRERFLVPVLTIVGYLPKDELAAMAQTLVGISSFRRRVSLEAETVGGPVDVAVTSKSDGFVWVQRKRYFDPTAG